MSPLIVDVELQNGYRWSVTLCSPGQDVIRICLPQPKVGVGWEGGGPLFYVLCGGPILPMGEIPSRPSLQSHRAQILPASPC